MSSFIHEYTANYECTVVRDGKWYLVCLSCNKHKVCCVSLICIQFGRSSAIKPWRKIQCKYLHDTKPTESRNLFPTFHIVSHWLLLHVSVRKGPSSRKQTKVQQQKTNSVTLVQRKCGVEGYKTGIRRIPTFPSTTDRKCDGVPIIL